MSDTSNHSREVAIRLEVENGYTEEEARARVETWLILTRQMEEIKALNDSILMSLNFSPDDPITQVHHALRQAYDALYELRRPFWIRNDKAKDDSE